MPQSRFQRLLRDRLADLGHEVFKINFCGGDALLWARRGASNFCGGAGDWPEWFNGFLNDKKPTDLLLIGDRRPLHQMAILMAKLRGISVFVFDEGYLRPQFITLERNGTNGLSEIPRVPAEILARGAGLPKIQPHPNIPTDIYQKVWDAFRFHCGNVVLWPLFRHYRTHRPQTIARELTGLLPKYFTSGKRAESDKKALADFLGRGLRYFFLPLQLAADMQIRRYSDFFSVKEVVAAVLSSFRRAAPPDLGLLVRSHPLDWQINRHKRFTLNYAKAIGLEGRICYVDEGSTNDMISGAEGLALVNSTTGLTALGLGKPVFCLGQALYALPGLARQGSSNDLDAFWSDPGRPDSKLCDAFIRLLQDQAVLPGNFYTPEGMSLAIDGALRRLGL